MTIIRRSILKYPFFYFTLFLVTLGLVSKLIDKSGIADLLFIISSIAAIIVGCTRLMYILRHGYFGIPALPLIGMVTALVLKQTETAAVLALLLSVELAAFSWIQSISNKKTSLLQLKHSQFVRFLDTASLPYVVLVVLIAGAVWTISSESTRFLEVIAAASSFPLLLAPAVGMLRGMNKLSKQGVAISNAALFEKLAEVKTVILRKSITLASRELKVASVHSLGKRTKADVLKVAAALASQSVHRASIAIVSYTGAAQKIDRAKHTTEVEGQGIRGRMKGSELIIGRPSFLLKHGITLDTIVTKHEGPEVYVGQDGELLGVIAFQETVLPGSKNLQKALLKCGVNKIVVVGGSSNKAVATIAKLAGIKQYHGNIVSNDVIELIESEELKPVAFVGDSIRDEATLTAADVAITVNETDQRSAVNIADYTPARLVSTFEVAIRTLRSTLTEVFILLLLSLILVLVAATGKVNVIHLALINLAFVVGYTSVNALKYSKAKDSQQ